MLMLLALYIPYLVFYASQDAAYQVSCFRDEDERDREPYDQRERQHREQMEELRREGREGELERDTTRKGTCKKL